MSHREIHSTAVGTGSILVATARLRCVTLGCVTLALCGKLKHFRLKPHGCNL